MFVGLDQVRIDLSEALANHALDRIVNGDYNSQEELEALEDKLVHYDRCADTQRFIRDVPAHQSLLAQEILNIHLACDGKSAKRQRR